jgi:hypothetical protein
MTPKERVLNVLRGEKTDCVPWFGDLDYWATSLIARGEKDRTFKTSDDYIQWHRDLACGFYLQGYFPFKTTIENCEQKVWHEGPRRYEEITTPKGKLRQCWHYLESSYSEAPEEHLVKTEDDLPAYTYMIEHTRYEPDYSLALLRGKQVDGIGVVLVYTPKTPFMQLTALDAGIVNVVSISSSAPEAFSETIALMHKKFSEAVEIAVSCPADIVMIPENLSSEMVGRRYFELFMRDIQREWSEKIKAAGKFSCIHMDGTLKGLLREECAVGLSFIEACTPAPVGDVPVKDWHTYREGGDTILWGGIPGVYFTEKTSDEEFESFLKETLSVMRSEGRYVLGVADQVPPDGLERRVKRVAEMVEEYGYY